MAALLAATLPGLACRPGPTPPSPPASEAARTAPPEASGAEAAASSAERCRSIELIEIWKASHTLRAYCSEGGVLTMRVALGRNPEGTKLRSGDRRTPEGRYAISGPARPSRFHLFIPIDYPSAADAERALAEGRVDAMGYERIVEAHERGEPPPQDTPLGGYIGLHGEGASREGHSARVDWTFGCIAVTDGDIERLAEAVEVGVPVWIHP